MEQLYAELFEAAGVGRRVGETIAGTAGQTQARWQTLWILGSGGTLTVPQVSRRLGVSRQNIQRLADQLQQEGLVALEPNPDHKTSPLLALTTEGRQALERINLAAEASHLEILEQFPASDVAALRALLRRFTAAMRTDPLS
ncbi:MarR family transcriptional regulator [Solirubrobacter phytolaccae]|uniref:MarR family transcriptional regulator n=1 Tax=Solirubrobacter phytolaccae TaxID=1404360 RepID=A0A9X3N4F3_9ACTN|nr:MarR family transcriptional regulator [Solirubrobacter phytolaccae]MDA0179518.1 MarR family transcriptional regulator [Solirubrobacter phytolaccae]